MLNLDFEPLSDDPFRASFRPIFPGKPLVRSWFSPGLTTRDKELVRDGDDSLTFLISNAKGLEAAQLGRWVRLGAGEATILRVESPGYVGANRHFGFDALMILRAEFLERAAGALDSAVDRIPRQSEPLRLLRAYIRVLEKQAFADGPLHESAWRHIVDLASLAVSIHPEIGESDLESVFAARTAAAIEYINAHFREPNLSLGSAATALKISTRYLQKLFERTGTSFTAQVNRVRLDYAYALLRQGNAMKVSDIALQSGFSDVSHFNRMFRARFGETPTDVRGAPHDD